MPSRNLFTDAQAIATLYALTERRLKGLPSKDAEVLRTAKRRLEASDRLTMRAAEREGDLVLVYEPAMDYPEDSTPETRFCKQDGLVLTECFEDNPFSMRHEPRGSALATLRMQENAMILRAAACSNNVKRALSKVA